ncbi:MAG: replication initiation protein, partial [Spirochaetales bacterium]|nr:replication initiation protein [Spirochaetales bacterium]
MEKGNRLIKQPYAITMARHRLNVHEMRIMVRIIEAMQPNMVYAEDRSVVQQTLLGDTILHLRTKDLLPSKSENYACVKRALKSLEQKVISIRGKDSKGEYETN